MENTLEVTYARPWLESLGAGELEKLAEDLGIDIPPGLERIFIIEELLLESAALCEQKSEDDIEINPSYTEAVALPKQYNISFIDVITRDPLWVYVFWEIKSHDREAHENASDFGGYCLRVIPLTEEENVPMSRENSFTVSINANDSARYLGFAEHSLQSAGRYMIKLGVIRGDAELQLAMSAPFSLPRLIENECINALEENPLIRLSGVQDFTTIKNTDRALRVKRQ
jgi:hypothetical protein